MLAKKFPRSVRHSGNIERPCFMVRIATPKGGNDGCVHDAVKVGFPRCGKSRMEIVRGFFDLHYADVAPEIPVDRRTQLSRRETSVQYNIRDLTLGMNAGIRAP